MFKKQNGITLVALVITIIVLLILAGVTISMVLGNNGVLNKAKESGDTQRKAEAQEQLQAAVMGNVGDFADDIAKGTELTFMQFLAGYQEPEEDGDDPTYALQSDGSCSLTGDEKMGDLKQYLEGHTLSNVTVDDSGDELVITGTMSLNSTNSWNFKIEASGTYSAQVTSFK